jgi:hypothetical protein
MGKAMNAKLWRGMWLVGVVGCFGAGCHQPLAVANPLINVAAWAGPVDRPAVGAPTISSPTIRNTRRGLAVVGSRGDALNTATRLHQRLLAARVPNVVVCEMTASGIGARSELRIAFPKALTPAQQQAVAKALADFDAAPRG